jgi:hypothetical protein
LYRTGPVPAAIALVLVLASCGGGGGSSSGAGSSGAGTGASTTGGITTSPASGGADVERAGTTAKHKAARQRHRGQVEQPQEFIPPPGDYETEATAKLATSAKSGSGCTARLANLVDRMDDLRQALLSGLDYSEYVLRVQAVRAAYEAVPVDRLGLACVAGPGNHAEDAFNQYLRAANLWGECAGTAGCAASSIESRLQHRWKIASKNLDAAKRS